MIPTCSSLEILLAGKAKYKEFQNMMNIYEFDIEHKYTPEKERLQRIKDMYVITNDESFIMYMVNISGYKQTMKLLKLMVDKGHTFISQCNPENAHIIKNEISQKEQMYTYYLTYYLR
jgi:hypothetical protein